MIQSQALVCATTDFICANGVPKYNHSSKPK